MYWQMTGKTHTPPWRAWRHSFFTASWLDGQDEPETLGPLSLCDLVLRLPSCLLDGSVHFQLYNRRVSEGGVLVGLWPQEVAHPALGLWACARGRSVSEGLLPRRSSRFGGKKAGKPVGASLQSSLPHDVRYTVLDHPDARSGISEVLKGGTRQRTKTRIAEPG